VPFHLWDSFPVVIEAAGVQQTLDYATWLTAHGGRLVVAGYHADGQRSVNMQTWNWKGIDVINAHERDPTVCVRGLRSGLAAAKEHRLDIDRLITHRWGLHQVTEGFTTLETRPPGFIKGVVEL
jgi:threonine dehydrogenase-like Zn-dependent dehydrogenase